MIIIDTNVISEVMKVSPSEKVLAWLNGHDADTLFITAITIAEISYGLNVLPAGSRRTRLDGAFNQAIIEAFKYRILAFDQAAAHRYGYIMSYRKELGRPLGLPDGQIAAIAHTHGATIATRNIQDFLDCGVELFDPFL